MQQGREERRALQVEGILKRPKVISCIFCIFLEAKEMWIPPILHWRKLHWRCLGPLLLPISQLTLLLSQLLGSSIASGGVCCGKTLRFALHWLLLLGWWVSRKSHGEGWVVVMALETFVGSDSLDGAKVQMGCHTKETRLFVTQKVQKLSELKWDIKDITITHIISHLQCQGILIIFRGRTDYQCIKTHRFCSAFWELVPG